MQGGDVFISTFRIAAEKATPEANERLDKVGHFTGWTSGLVTDRICADIRWGKLLPYSSDPSNAALRCQHQVAATNYYGDSGAPVFYYDGTSSVTLAGILVVRHSNDLFWYTSTDMIRLDLGIPVGSQTGLKTIF